MNDGPMFANQCVFVSYYTMRIGPDGKNHRVKRVVPRVYGGTIYTMYRIDGKTPFVGWTYGALRRGRAARHYGKCTVLPEHSSAVNVGEWLQSFLSRPLEYGHPWFGGSPIQVEWDGKHRGNFVTIDGVEVEMIGCGDAAPNTEGFGNLAWAMVTGLCIEHGKQSLALLDLESIRGDDPYIDAVHAVNHDYDNGGVYLSMVKHVFNERARRVINNAKKGE